MRHPVHGKGDAAIMFWFAVPSVGREVNIAQGPRYYVLRDAGLLGHWAPGRSLGFRPVPAVTVVAFSRAGRNKQSFGTGRCPW